MTAYILMFCFATSTGIKCEEHGSFSGLFAHQNCQRTAGAMTTKIRRQTDQPFWYTCRPRR